MVDVNLMAEELRAGCHPSNVMFVRGPVSSSYWTVQASMIVNLVVLVRVILFDDQARLKGLPDVQIHQGISMTEESFFLLHCILLWYPSYAFGKMNVLGESEAGRDQRRTNSPLAAGPRELRA